MRNLLLALTLFAVANAAAVDQQFTPQYVDLGLPSGTLWATCNVGADKPEGLGDYFAWGETKPKTVYEWSSYAYMNDAKMDGRNGMKKDSNWFNINKYTFDCDLKGGIWYSGVTFIGDNKKTLEAIDDAAAANWGGDWAMPTADDWKELISNSYFAHTDNYSGKSGWLVYKAKAEADKGKTDGTPSATYSTADTHIFLPAAGYNIGTIQKASECHYWSSSLSEYHTQNAQSFEIDSRNGARVETTFSRDYGNTVRPVCPRSGKTNGHVAVDLGLPSGKMWATSNVGAKTPQAAGNYYMWGMTTKPKTYGITSYKHMLPGWEKIMGKEFVNQYQLYIFINKYQIPDENCGGTWFKWKGNSWQFLGDGKKTLDAADDAATANWGGKWRMPTQKEWEELYKNSYGVWTENYNGSGVNGWVFYKAKAAANKNKRAYKGQTPLASYSLSDTHIFLPASGQWWSNINDRGKKCNYWLSNLGGTESRGANGINIGPKSTDFAGIGGGTRFMGYTVRPVLDKKNANSPIPQVKAPKYYKITIVQPEHGTIESKNENLDLSKPVKEGTKLTFWSRPAAGYTNYSETWKGSPCDENGTFIVTGDATVTCKFKPKNAPAQTVTATTTTTTAEPPKASTSEKTETTKKKKNSLFKSLFRK
ncbi:MAG: hypothetical protein IJ905_09195 [Fibrobacter sp.]|nr:hypothetical protein [Fibrobacter sp.]